MKRNKKNNSCCVGIIFVSLGIGIISVCVFPSEWIIVITSLTLVAAGVIQIKR